MKCLIVIPARLASSRLSEKLLLRAGGKSVLQHTYEAASRSGFASEVVVAVDDPRLAAEVDSFGGQALLTSPNCPSGTDRIAEVALRRDDVDILVNVQGDEPEMDPATIDTVGQLLAGRPDADMATAATPIRTVQRLEDPGVVKVAVGQNQRAITFTRAPIPFVRDGVTKTLLQADPPNFWHHIGLYAYRRECLMWFATQPQGSLEKLENLEQLRAIEAGKTILVAPVPAATPGIDTLSDFREFTARVEG